MRQGEPMTASRISPGPGRRLGPRPLPLHLAMAGMLWRDSRGALPSLKNGSIDWNDGLGPKARKLSAAIDGAPDAELAAALDTAACARLSAFIDGILRYRRHPFCRDLPDPPVIWAEGAMQVHGYGPEDGPPVLVVPSMINRGYVLDIAHDRSLMRSLAARGYRATLVEWGWPGPQEAGMTLEAALARLLRALDAVAAGRRVALVGYCMGGLLMLAAALARRPQVAGAAFLATPWDFHAGGRVQAHALAHWAALFVPQFRALGTVPVDMLQVLFTALDPFLALDKFTAFAELDPDGEEARAFVAVEDWLNDGIPLPAEIAAECMQGWYGENRPAEGRWTVGDLAVRPQDFDAPAIVFLPERDRIVPPGSARALGESLPGARVHTLRAGHIGMVVGRRAPAGLYDPLAAWLDGLAWSPVAATR